MRRGVVRVVLAITAVVASTGCAVLPDELGGRSESDTGSSDNSGEPEELRTIPPQLRECGESDEPEVALTKAAVAADATWTIPAGYQEASGYYDDLDYEEQTFLVALVPGEPGFHLLDLLGVIGYDGLDWGAYARSCDHVPVEAVLERVSQYQKALGATALTEAKLTQVAGRPAVTQSMEIAEYSFEGYWLFSQTELLFIGCQWTSEEAREEIHNGCADLVRSVNVG